ncbi:MAG: dihydrodipicolinate synthase family protein [Planctomycetota bacterium]|nr:MAG: dihydrodipicolinate synthase family protein [Planctomycetota bacterium]
MKRYPQCIMATCCVPWDEQGQFMEEVFRRGVGNTLRDGTRHLYVFGTAGEGYAVTDEQFFKIATAFVDEMRSGNAEPMVGVIHLSLGTILERIERCREMGVRDYQISLPSWGALSEREVFTFFQEVCGRFRDCRFLHYNLPRTKRLVTPEEYARLAEEHPNLVATKNSSDSFSTTARLLEQAPQLQHFLSETGFAYGSQFSECGLLASLVTGWSELRRLLRAGIEKDAATLTQVTRDVRIYFEQLRFLMDPPLIDGAYDKMFARIHDPEFPLRLLPPYESVGEEEFKRFEAALREKLPHWMPPLR